MPSHAPHWIAAGGLRGLADNATATVIALLSLLAIAVLGYGLIRAIVANRRPQIILAELKAPAGNADLAEAVALSSLARQTVRRQINDQRAQITRVGQDVLAPASAELELVLDDADVAEVQDAARDSVGTLLAALRAVTPDSADRFVGLFSVVLPPPRGASVGITLVQRGTDDRRRIGLSVEVVRLDGHLLGSVTFWEPEPGTAADEAGSTDRILALLEPVSRWIAVRLVLALMVSPRRRVNRPSRLGLGHLLVGGMFLQAMRDYVDHALTFGEQAGPELERARQLLSRIPLPVITLAAVHERMGWARHRSGQPVPAADSFRAAAKLWRAAEDIVRDGTDPDQAKLAIYVDRRLKAELESGDPVLGRAALGELGSVSEPEALLANRVWLYNRACLYAQASKAESSTAHRERALLWLGLGLRFFDGSGMWDYAARQDPELEPIRSFLGPFLACLRTLMPRQPGQLTHAQAQVIVAQAVSATSPEQPLPAG